MFRPVKDRIEYGGAMIGHEEKAAILRVIEQQGGKRWTIGPESTALEQELADTTGVKRAVLTNSGSSALLVALAALKLPKQSNVIIPALNFPTAFNAILQNNYNPVVVDIDPDTMNISLDQIRELVDKGWKFKAVVAVNIAANPVNLQELRKIVGEDVKIVLDNCDGYGTTYRGEFVDTFADVSCVSFHAAHIITMGEGGAVLTNDEKIANTAKKMREWGRADGTDEIYEWPGFPDDYRSRYVYEEIGWNLKPLELQCAMGRVQLKRLKDFKKKRLYNFERLRTIIEQLPKFKIVKDSWPGAETCWFSVPFTCEGVSRKETMEYLEKNNIECRTIFSGNVLLHPAYKDVKVSNVFEPYPHATKVMRDGMFISSHPSLTDEQINFIGKTLGEL